MTAPVRMRLSRAKGFSLQAASRAINGLPAVNCARPGKWGNPWSASLREHAVVTFRRWLDGIIDPPDLRERRFHLLSELRSLRGHNLACWCPLPAPGGPDHCHAAVLLEIANR